MRAQFREICNTIGHAQNGSRAAGDDVTRTNSALDHRSHSIEVRLSEEETAAFQVVRLDRPRTLMAAMEAANIAHRLLLRSMSRIRIFRKVLLLLRRHFRGVRLARNTAWPKQSSRYVVFAQTGLAIFELPIASVT
jgi:hypothetical protein